MNGPYLPAALMLAAELDERRDVPRDEHGNEAEGICMNCGAPMVYAPMRPWCARCDDENEPAPEAS